MNEQAFELNHEPIEIPESPLRAPVVTYLVTERVWRLEQEYQYRSAAFEIRVPRGFRFDLASIPRPIWWLVAPFELSIAAPLLHDFLYGYAGDPPPGTVTPPRHFTRSEADDLFRQVMREEGVWGWRRQAAYAAVRLFGGPAWGKDLAS